MAQISRFINSWKKQLFFEEGGVRFVLECDRSIPGCTSNEITSLIGFAEEMRTLGAQLSLNLSATEPIQ